MAEGIHGGGAADRMPSMFFGPTPQSSVAATPVMNPENSRARVNVIQTGGGVVGMATPILSEALRCSKVVKFSGKAEDFGEFEK